MSRATLKHYKESTSCPECGSRTAYKQYGSITTFYCRNRSCDWAMDWPTYNMSHPMSTDYGLWFNEEDYFDS